jgi:hypothetical protein
MDDMPERHRIYRRLIRARDAKVKAELEFAYAILEAHDDDGMPLRMIADAVGYSHQRIHQIVHSFDVEGAKQGAKQGAHQPGDAS